MARRHDRSRLIRLYRRGAQLLDLLAQPIVQLLEPTQVALVSLRQLRELAFSVLGLVGEFTLVFCQLGEVAFSALRALRQFALVSLRDLCELAISAFGPLDELALTLGPLREFALVGLGEL